jgi:hypothetical protein
MAHLHIDMNVNDLAKFLFKENVDNKTINLNINGLENSKDLFCFCIDLLCKGLVISFGTDNKVCINTLSIEQFEQIKQKMKCVGIEVHLEVHPITEPVENMIDLWTQNFLNVQQVRASEENKRLHEYKFCIQTSEILYRIWFTLNIEVPTAPKNRIL